MAAADGDLIGAAAKALGGDTSAILTRLQSVLEGHGAGHTAAAASHVSDGQRFQLKDFLALAYKYSSGDVRVDMFLAAVVFVMIIVMTNPNSQIQPTQILWSGLSRCGNWLLGQGPPKSQLFMSSVVDMQGNYDYPQSFRAVMHKLSLIKDERVWHLETEDRVEYIDGVHNNLVEYNLLQDDAILLEPEIHVKLNTENENRPNPKHGGTLSVEVKSMTVYSNTLPVSSLKEVLKRWKDDYKAFKTQQVKDTQMVFMVRFPEGEDKPEEVQHVPFHTYRSFDNLFFEEKDAVLEEVDFFIKEKEWHIKRGLADSLGILGYGLPGCGKTSFIKALLKHTKRHGVIFSLNENTNLSAIERIMRTDELCNFPIPQDQRLYVLEDIDAMGAIVHKRESSETPKNDGNDGEKEEETAETKKTKKQLQMESEREMEKNLCRLLKMGLTKSSDHHLAFLLNLLDGLVEAKGRMLVMTTNHVDKLDPALIRPGRVDITLEFKRCTRQATKQILSHFYRKKDEDWELPGGIQDFQLTPADLCQLCRGFKHDFEAILKVLAQSGAIRRPSKQGIDWREKWTDPKPVKVLPLEKCDVNVESSEPVKAQ